MLPAVRPMMFVGVVLLLAIAGWAVFRPEPPLPGIVRDPAPEVRGLGFVDHWSGDAPTTVDLVPSPGGVTAAYFGYLSCPDMCPLTMGDLRRARELMGDDLAGRTTVAFVTLDPDRDGPDQLRRYLGAFFEEGVLALTAPDDAALTAATERLGVRFELEAPATGATAYEVAHTAITYLIDDRGVVVRELAFGTTPEEYARTLTAVLETTRSSRAAP